MTTVEFRFTGSRARWEPCPLDEVTAIALMGENYDLRINGEIRKATGPAGDER